MALFYINGQDYRGGKENCKLSGSGFDSHLALMDYSKFNKDEIETIIGNYFNREDVKKMFEEARPKHYVWEEDGQRYSAWEIGKGLLTGDGGKELYDKAFHAAMKKGFEKMKKQSKKWKK